jgi:hypothetical protein
MPCRIEFTMHYEEFVPTFVLRPFVRCYWHMASDGEPAAEITNRVLPDGCIDILYNLSDPLRRLGFEEELRQSTYLIGAMRKPSLVRFGRNLDVVGIRFQPGGPLHHTPIVATAKPFVDGRPTRIFSDGLLGTRIDRCL